MVKGATSARRSISDRCDDPEGLGESRGVVPAGHEGIGPPTAAARPPDRLLEGPGSNDNGLDPTADAPADPSAISRLTPGQRDCLRLVLAHYSSKEIAQKLGVGPSAVDKRIERAVETLGARSRFDAARLLAAAEGDRGSTKWAQVSTSPPTGSDGSDEPFLDFAAPSARLAENRVTWSGPVRMALVVGLVLALCISMLIVLTAADQATHLLRLHGLLG